MTEMSKVNKQRYKSSETAKPIENNAKQLDKNETPN